MDNIALAEQGVMNEIPGATLKDRLASSPPSNDRGAVDGQHRGKVCCVMMCTPQSQYSLLVLNTCPATTSACNCVTEASQIAYQNAN
jgi:hypothetical protein